MVRALSISGNVNDADPMPRTIEPMLATLAKEPFSDPRWLYETKWDGYRAISFVRDGQVSFVSHRGRSLDRRFPELSTVVSPSRLQPRFSTARSQRSIRTVSPALTNSGRVGASARSF